MMIQTKSPFNYGVTSAVVMVVVAVTNLSIDTVMDAYAQNMTTPPAAQQQNQTVDPEQIKNYLTQAIQAIDSGNNTKAAEQVGLAEDQLGGMTGTEVEDEDGEDEEEEGEVEDEDEPGEEETP
jgi:hypothetical protein